MQTTIGSKQYTQNVITNEQAITNGACEFGGTFRLFHHSIINDAGKVVQKFATVKPKGSPRNVHEALDLLAATPIQQWTIPSVDSKAEVQFKLDKSMTGERMVCLLVFRSQTLPAAFRLALPDRISQERYAEHLIAMKCISEVPATVPESTDANAEPSANGQPV